MMDRICISTLTFNFLFLFTPIYCTVFHLKTQSSDVSNIIEIPNFSKNMKVFFTSSKETDLITAMHHFLNKHQKDIDKLIPDKAKIVFAVQLSEALDSQEAIQLLSEAVARRTGIDVKTIQVSKYDVNNLHTHFKTYVGIVKMYFLHGLKRIHGAEVLHLRPTADILRNLTRGGRFRTPGKAMTVLGIISGQEYVQQMEHVWEKGKQQLFEKNWQGEWAMKIAITLLALGVLVLLTTLFIIPAEILVERFKGRKRKMIEEPKQVVIQPILRPVVAGVGAVQPLIEDQLLGPDTDSEPTHSPCRSPMRKGRGLLERRGSNASLTLDLNRSQESIQCGTPPKECSAHEYLQSASKRLNRRQLRSCLKDVKALHSEFWDIPTNHPEKVLVAGCGTKNRYKTILPNESSRVILPGNLEDPLSSYINANYIRGYGGESRAYIATQGPLPHTVDDFWRMTWQENSPLIVMITKLKEKAKVKCEAYIPESTGIYGDIEVSVVRVSPRDGYTVRELHLRRGTESRAMHHFWYTTWPDHKTPATAKQILGMALEAESLRVGQRPIIVHCSAGIGRSGCFIAASIGMQQLLEEDSVDILAIVCSLRLDRGGMIQTAEQYEFVHQALSLFERSLPET